MADSTFGRVSEGIKANATRARDEFASDALQQVSARLRDAAEEQKHRAAEGLRGFAHSLHDMAGGLERNHRDIAARYTQITADQLDRTAEAVDRRDIAEMAGEVEAFARARPALFVGGAFAAGFLVARLFKSMGAETESPYAPRHRTSSVAAGYAEYEPPYSPEAPASSAAPFTATPATPSTEHPASQS